MWVQTTTSDQYFEHRCKQIKSVQKEDFAFRWPNTVFARAFADAIQRAHKDFKKTNVTPALSVLLLSTIERSVLMALVFYCKGMLEKVTMQRTRQF